MSNAAEHTYTVHEVAAMSGTTVRTLHHYEQMGLLVPARQANGYRAYRQGDLARLQQILLYRTCGMELAAIKDVLDDPAFDVRAALEQHLALLAAKKTQLETLMDTVRTTIRALEGETTMTDAQRFEGLKEAAVAANEQRYGKEARERFGDAAIDAANDKLLAMDERTWNDMNELEAAIIEQLARAMATGSPESPESQQLAAMHARWIGMHWGDGAYNAKAHLALANGYLADERFTAYYDGRAGVGATEFLVAALESALG